MIFYIYSPKNSAKKLAFLTQNKAKICKILIITLVFEKKRQFFRRKLSKIAENCDHNIDPWDRCCDLKYISAEKNWRKIGDLNQITALNISRKD
jgi:hypothetical protein